MTERGIEHVGNDRGMMSGMPAHDACPDSWPRRLSLMPAPDAGPDACP